MGEDEIAQRVREAAKILDLETFLDRTPKACSGGQRRRVVMGRAIVALAAGPAGRGAPLLPVDRTPDPGLSAAQEDQPWTSSAPRT